MAKRSKDGITQFRGQGTLCRGNVTVTISGPQGSGKSLVQKVLADVLPLTPVASVTIIEVQTDK